MICKQKILLDEHDDVTLLDGNDFASSSRGNKILQAARNYETKNLKTAEQQHHNWLSGFH